MSVHRRGRKRKAAVLMESLITERNNSSPWPMTSSSNADCAHMTLEYNVNPKCEVTHNPGITNSEMSLNDIYFTKNCGACMPQQNDHST